MKTQVKIIFLFLILLIGTSFSQQTVSAQGYVSFQVFYDELSPYGTWVNNPDYGYVWVPDVAPGFSPYATDGYWVLTYEGWTWVSTYSWGWAPFHYGRWFSDPIYGPIWVPGNEWSPGWVTWRSSGDYYGWAPIGPGVSINVAYSSGYIVPSNQWVFVRNGDFGRTNIHNYYVNTSNNVTIINNSTVINNTRIDKSHNVTYNAGPARNDVEKHIGKSITPVAIREMSKPGEKVGNNQLQIYRPKVQKEVSGGGKPAPTRVESLKNVKPADQRTVTTPQQKTNQPVNQQQMQPSKQQQQQPKQQQVQPPKQEQQHQAQPPIQQEPKKQQAQPPKQQQQQPKQQQVQPPKQQQQQQQHQAQPPKQQQQQPKQQQAQPPKQQQQQQQHQAQPPKQQQQPKQQQAQPPKQQQQPQQQHQAQPPKQQQPKQPQSQKDNPPKMQ